MDIKYLHFKAEKPVVKIRKPRSLATGNIYYTGLPKVVVIWHFEFEKKKITYIFVYNI